MIASVPASPLAESKTEGYRLLAEQARALFAGETDLIANAANLAALIYHSLPHVNWAGFYFLQGNELVLGPFQGQPACMRIEMGQGVCGTAAGKRETLIVPDVHEFPGHIACDSASNSEIVLPIVRNGDLVGVLDLDSPNFSRFDHEDATGLGRLVEVFQASMVSR